jgi:hypothetical protein
MSGGLPNRAQYMKQDFKMWHAHMQGLKQVLHARENLVPLTSAKDDETGPCSLNPALRVALGW